MSLFKQMPIATLVAWGTAVFGFLVVVQSTHLLTGSAARWADLIAGFLQLVLTAYAHRHVTPVAAPRDAVGRRLVPVSMQKSSPPPEHWRG